VATANQAWVHNAKPVILIRDMARFYRVDAALRAQRIAEWNRPVWWPIALLAAAALVLVWLARRSYAARERATARGRPFEPGAAAAPSAGAAD